MASTVSVTNIHSWLLEMGSGSELASWRTMEDAHLELLGLKHQGQVEELAGREHELEKVGAIWYGLVDERLEEAELGAKEVSDALGKAEKGSAVRAR